MVVNRHHTGQTPKVEHPTKALAEQEAKRLAKAHPGQCFAILKATTAFMGEVTLHTNRFATKEYPPGPRGEYELRRDVDDGIPF